MINSKNMRKLIIVMLVIIGIGKVLGQNQEKPARLKVAVYVSGALSKDKSDVLGDYIVSAFVNSGTYSAIERTEFFLTEINKEQKYQNSGNVDDAQISKLGKQFGVNYVCIINVKQAYGSYYISARLIDVETAEVKSAANKESKFENSDEIRIISEYIITELEKDQKTRSAEISSKNDNREKKETFEKKDKTNREDGFTVFDNLAIQLATSGNVDFETAKDFCDCVSKGGMKKWRLPTVGELTQIYANKEIIWKNKDDVSPWRGNYRENNSVWSADVCDKKNKLYKTIDVNGSNNCENGKFHTICVKSVK
jgi:TolB-like protein